MFFKVKTLEGILSTFEKTAGDLARHVEKKTQEQLELLADRSYIDDLIDATADEVDRAHRVLSKVKEFVS